MKSLTGNYKYNFFVDKKDTAPTMLTVVDLEKEVGDLAATTERMGNIMNNPFAQQATTTLKACMAQIKSVTEPKVEVQNADEMEQTPSTPSFGF